jgi:hypothetical protein
MLTSVRVTQTPPRRQRSMVQLPPRGWGAGGDAAGGAVLLDDVAVLLGRTHVVQGVAGRRRGGAEAVLADALEPQRALVAGRAAVTSSQPSPLRRSQTLRQVAAFSPDKRRHAMPGPQFWRAWLHSSSKPTAFKSSRQGPLVAAGLVDAVAVHLAAGAVHRVAGPVGPASTSTPESGSTPVSAGPVSAAAPASGVSPPEQPARPRPRARAVRGARARARRRSAGRAGRVMEAGCTPGGRRKEARSARPGRGRTARALCQASCTHSAGGCMQGVLSGARMPGGLRSGARWLAFSDRKASSPASWLAH